MDVELWLCIGGPLHGKHRPAGPYPIVGAHPRSAVQVDAANVTVDGHDVSYAVQSVQMVVPPPPTVLYYPRRVRLPGWRVVFRTWLAVSETLEVGSVLPGSVAGVLPVAHVACRWCWGRPMDGVDYCSRTECITHVSALRALDAMVTIGDGWGGRHDRDHSS